MSSRRAPFFALCLLLDISSIGAVPVAAVQESQGFIYGRAITKSGAHFTGFVRWGDEEAFWDDLFHAAKSNQHLPKSAPYGSPSDDRDGKRVMQIFDRSIRVDDRQKRPSRLFVSRFGNIREIRPFGDGNADVLMKNGRSFEVSNYGNDVRDAIHLLDDKAGEMILRWERIESVEFMPTPTGIAADVRRLFGRVDSSAGSFEGFIQWDQDESLSSDYLDGETQDGDARIAFGLIRSIERDGWRRASVELKDGRFLRLSGKGDVNDDNRGIVIEDPRYGRVTVSWTTFSRVVFTEVNDSGKGYEEYGDDRRLRGSVIARNGEKHTGFIVVDLDEAEGWEILNGSHDGVNFDIPFNRVASIAPDGLYEASVVLRNGERLVLEDSQDLSGDNRGVLIHPDDDAEPIYIEWGAVETILFAW